MNRKNPFVRGAPRDTRGFALPLALLGLVVISVLVTGVLLSSTTEVALSGAHRDAAVDLYSAESAIEAYVAEHGTALEAVSGVSFNPTGKRAMRIDVARLRMDSVETNDRGEAIFSVRAKPANGGRTVTAMIRVPLVRGIGLAPESAITSGATNVHIGGSSLISGKQNRDLCTEGPDSVAAITLTNDVKSKNIDSSNVVGDVKTTDYDRYELARRLFSPSSLDQLADGADVKIKQKPTGNQAGKAESNTSVANPLEPSATPWNWGCPLDVMRIMGLTPCVNDSDVNYYPVVAIDAKEFPANKVSLAGDHGQGVLIVLNGDLDLTAHFSYKGIIVVEGSTTIQGGSGQGGSKGSAKIEGALISFGDVTLENPDDPDTGEETKVTGGAVVSYNFCAIQSANQAINKKQDLRRSSALAHPTFAWSELVR